MVKKLKEQRKRKPVVKVPEPVQNPAAPIRNAVMVIIGGTADKPVRADAAQVAPVRPEEISQYGTDRKRVIVGLAMNLLAGIPLSRDILNKDNEIWGNRSLRTDKLAFFKILESGLTQAQLLDAWNQTLAQRKRYDEPTLQALSKAARAFKILNGQLEPRVSPMEKFARDCLAVINNRALDTAEIIRQLRAKLTEKANYDAERPMPQQVAA